MEENMELRYHYKLKVVNSEENEEENFFVRVSLQAPTFKVGERLVGTYLYQEFPNAISIKSV